MTTRAHTQEFHLEHFGRDGVQILALTGYLGNAEFAQVDQALSPLLAEKHGRVILDLTNLAFSTTLSLARFLVCGQTFRRRGGELKFVGLSPRLLCIAEMAGFKADKDFEPDVATAVRKLGQVSKTKSRLPLNRK